MPRRCPFRDRLTGCLSLLALAALPIVALACTFLPMGSRYERTRERWAQARGPRRDRRRHGDR